MEIIIAFPRLADAQKLKTVLKRNGYDDILACNSASAVISAANESDGGIVICGYRIQGMMFQELYGYLPREFQMLLVASPSKLEECSSGDIMCLPMPIQSRELVSTVQTMMMELQSTLVRRRGRGPQKPEKEKDRKTAGEPDQAPPGKRSPEAQRIIDKAKALLMERNGLSEQEAHKYIQKLSMDSGNNLVETAEMILAFE